MSKIEQVQTEIQRLQLSPQEMESVREWLEDILEDHMELREDFRAKIEHSLQEMKDGHYSRVRRPGENS